MKIKFKEITDVNFNGIIIYRQFRYSKEFKKMLKENGLNIKYVINNYLDSGVDEIIFKKSCKEFKKIRLLVDSITGEYSFSGEKFNDF